VKIKIICVGKIKEKYIISGISEYSKRLSKYCNLDIIEVMDENFIQNPNLEEIEMIKIKEENKILKHINDKDYLISLALTGKQLTSEELADNINHLTITGYSTITFIIGGSYGLSRKYIKKIKHAFKFFKINIPTSII
jgi:ribosomal RNA large subunit methyltransferase H